MLGGGFGEGTCSRRGELGERKLVLDVIGRKRICDRSGGVWGRAYFC